MNDQVAQLLMDRIIEGKRQARAVRKQRAGLVVWFDFVDPYPGKKGFAIEVMNEEQFEAIPLGAVIEFDLHPVEEQAGHEGAP